MSWGHGRFVVGYGKAVRNEGTTTSKRVITYYAGGSRSLAESW